MSNNKTAGKTAKNVWEATSYEELEALGVTFEDVLRALKAKEDSRLAHKKAYLRRQLILERAKAAGITGA